MAVSEPYTLAGVLVGATEISIITGTTTRGSLTDDGVYQLFVDPIASALVIGDEFVVRLYEKCLAASSQEVSDSWRIHGPWPELWKTPMFTFMHGIDVTFQRVSATSRNIYASLRKVG